jgi:hypothetical protein
MMLGAGKRASDALYVRRGGRGFGLGVSMPITYKMKAVTMSDVDFLLVRAGVGCVAEARPSIYRSWTSSPLNADLFVVELRKELSSCFERAAADLLMFG